MEQSVYRAKLLCKDTWVIYLGDTTAYLIAGEREGMMIDSGNTPGPLREFCEETCGRPVRLVANTHGHFDHTGGNGYFKAAFIGRLASRIAKTPNGSVRAEDFPMDYEMARDRDLRSGRSLAGLDGLSRQGGAHPVRG